MRESLDFGGMALVIVVRDSIALSETAYLRVSSSTQDGLASFPMCLCRRLEDFEILEVIHSTSSESVLSFLLSKVHGTLTDQSLT